LFCVEDAVDVIATLDRSRAEELLRAEIENLQPLDTATVAGGYQETFDATLLRELHALVKSDPVAFARRHGKTKDSVESLQRNIAALMGLVQDGDSAVTMPVGYHYIFAQLGRRYAPSPAFQTLDGGLRKLIAAPHYFDIDFANCYPVLLMNVCRTLHKPPILDIFVSQWEQMLSHLRQFYDCSRAAAKQLVLKHLHGGKVGKWLTDWSIRDDICARAARDGHSRVVIDLERESAAIADFFVASFPEFGDLLERIVVQERANGVAPHNQSTTMTALAHGLATLEAHGRRPMVDGEHHHNAADGAIEPLTLASQRKLVENLRQALVSASRATRASNLSDAQQTSLIRQYDAAYTGLGDVADGMNRTLRRQELTQDLSARQERSCVDWDQLLAVSGPLFREFLDTVQDPTVATAPSKWKRMQNILLLAMHTAIPPGRNDFVGLRFAAGAPDAQDLRDSRSPNYVQVAADGAMTLVLNAYKTDRKTLSDQYDAAQGDFLIDHALTLRRELKPDPVLTKYGFRPRLVAEMLAMYMRASATGLRAAVRVHLLRLDRRRHGREGGKRRCPLEAPRAAGEERHGPVLSLRRSFPFATKGRSPATST
jgi:hypothetical protein